MKFLGRRRATAIALIVAGFAMISVPASAADKNIGVMATSEACGGTYYSVISGTASRDGSAKVDFHNLKFGARAAVPTSCAGLVTRICLDAVLTANSKGGGISASAPFGETLAGFQTVSTAVRSGSFATQSASSCVSGRSRILTLSAKPVDGTAFVTTGGYYKLANYSLATRATVWIGGVKYVGSWATSFQKP